MIVIGLGYGDEGKGLVTSYLCSQVKNPMVVRFNGGHQAGHTVVHKGIRHVFSNFGSGTLRHVPTYWSKQCTVHPTGIVNEFNKLKELKIDFDRTPIRLTLDLDCPVTTPYDVEYNRIIENTNKHGSVGVGFGTTLERHENGYKLCVRDLFYPKILEAKLKLISSYYGLVFTDKVMEAYLRDVELMKNIVGTTDNFSNLSSRYDLVFEGAQGILLDMDHGFFPNVTRSNTTCKNVVAMGNSGSDVYYVTRCYQTRHGAGFMTNETSVELLGLKNHEEETNKFNLYQREFRVGHLDTDLLNYALECDAPYSRQRKKNLVITCCDQLDVKPLEIVRKLNVEFDKVFISEGPSAENIEQII